MLRQKTIKCLSTKGDESQVTILGLKNRVLDTDNRVGEPYKGLTGVVVLNIPPLYISSYRGWRQESKIMVFDYAGTTQWAGKGNFSNLPGS